MTMEARYGTNRLGLEYAMKKWYLKQGITKEAGLEMALRSNTRDYKTFEQQTSFLKAEVDTKKCKKGSIENEEAYRCLWSQQTEQ